MFKTETKNAKPTHINHGGYTISRAYCDAIVLETKTAAYFCYPEYRTKEHAVTRKESTLSQSMLKAVEVFKAKEAAGEIVSWTFRNETQAMN